MTEGMKRRPRVLVVEDNPLLARFTTLLLTQFGCDVVGPTARIDDAIALATTEPLDAALLDVNVAGGSAVPVAEVLDCRGTPYAVMTGYGRQSIPAAFQNRPCLYKPFREFDLKSAMTALIGAEQFGMRPPSGNGAL